LIIIHIDGLCEPINPGGTATYGYVIKNSDTGKVIARKSGLVGKGPSMSNNVAEYAALCEALRDLMKQGWENELIEIRGDSKLVINQMAGNWKFREGLYEEKYREAKNLASYFTKLTFKWVPRDDNEEADALTRDAYERALKSP